MEPHETKWAHFCDFQEITHIVVKDCNISIHRQDNKCLVGESVSSTQFLYGVLTCLFGELL